MQYKNNSKTKISISAEFRKRTENKVPYFIDTIYHELSNKVEKNNLLEVNYSHLVVFCGKGLTLDLCNALNQLADISNNLLIGVTNRNEKELKQLNKKVLRIPLYIPETEIPKGISSENYLICELKSIAKFIKKNKIRNKFFTRIRKDIFLNPQVFLEYLQVVPSLTKRYPIICSELSSNLLRRYCLSDHFFTTPMGMIKDQNFIYRIKSDKQSLFWWKFRHIKPYEILSNNHQMEQWLWSNLLKNNFSVSLEMSYSEYLNYLSKYFLIIPTWQIGYFWTRSSEFYLRNWVKFLSEGHDLFKTTMPFRGFISYSSFFEKVYKDKNILSYLLVTRILIYMGKLFKLFIILPIYYLKYLLDKKIK